MKGDYQAGLSDGVGVIMGLHGSTWVYMGIPIDT